MQGWLQPDRRIAAIGDLVFWLYADPGGTGGRGALGLPGADLSVIVFAVLVSEGDGRGMNPGKLSDYAGMPRPTLYRRIGALRRRGVLAPGDAVIRAEHAFLESESMTSACLAAGCAIARCASAIDPGIVETLGENVFVTARPRGTSTALLGILGSLALDLARLSHAGPSPWFGAQSRTWLVRWAIARAGAEGRFIRPGKIAEETGLSRTAVYRQLAQLGGSGALLRDGDGTVGMALTGAAQARRGGAAGRMGACVLTAFHRLSELDSYPPRT